MSGAAVDVLTMGEVMVCLAAPTGEPLARAKVLRKSIGGAEANTAIGLRRLGHSVRWVSRLGVDPFGDQVLATLREEGVDLSAVRRSSAPTGVMFKETAGPRSSVHYYRHGSAASGLGAADVDPADVRSARLVHLSGITLALGPGPAEAVHAVLALCREAGVPVSFDPNVRDRLVAPEVAARQVLGLLPAVTHLLVNEREAALLSGRTAPDDAAAALADLGVPAVVVTCAGDGAVAVVDGRTVRRPAWPVARVVDPVGAGDAFNAGWISAQLRGAPPAEALDLACWVASQVVSHAGDYEGFPSAADSAQWRARAGAA